MLHRLAKAKGHVVVSHLVNQLVHNFKIDEFQGSWTLINDRHLHAKGGKHGGILNADHPRPHHSHGLGQGGQPHHMVRGDDGLAIRRDVARITRAGANRDEDVLCRQHAMAVKRFHPQGMRIHKAGVTLHQGDAIARQRIVDHVHFLRNDAIDLGNELRHARPDLRRVWHGVQSRLGLRPPHRFAKRFRGNGAGFKTGAAKTGLLFDHCRLFAQLGRLNGGALTGRTTANTEQIVGIVPRHQRSPWPR